MTRPYGGSDPEGGLVFSEELRHDVRDAVSAVIWAHGRSGVDVSEAQTYGFDDAGRLKEYTQGLWSAATGTVTGSPTARHDYTLDEQSNWREHQGRAGSARLSPSVSSINAYTNWPTDIDGNGATESQDREIDGQLGFVWKKEERELASGSKRTMKHVHDGLGRLVEVLKDGVSQVRYGYTADGRLAWRREVAAGRAVWYVHDGRQVIQEIQTAPSAVLVQEYCWQETTLLETRKPGGWIRTLHQDRLGSVVAATAGGGGTVTIEARTAYDPYGRPVSLPSWSAAGVESIVPFGYTGARWEDLAALDVDVDADGTVESVGLYAMGARWYDAEMGRFLEQDPLGEVAGSNLYAYVDASPVMWVDPSGLLRSHERNKAAVDFYDRLSPFTMGARAMAASLAGGRRNARSKTEAGRRYEDAQRFARYMKAWGADFEDQARAQVGMGAVLSLTVMGETSDGKLALMWTVESGATRQPGEVGSALAPEEAGGSGGAVGPPSAPPCDYDAWVPANVHTYSSDPVYPQKSAKEAVCMAFRAAAETQPGSEEIERIRSSPFEIFIHVERTYAGAEAGLFGRIIWDPRIGWQIGDKGIQSPALNLFHEIHHQFYDPTESMGFENALARAWSQPERADHSDGGPMPVFGPLSTRRQDDLSQDSKPVFYWGLR